MGVRKQLIRYALAPGVLFLIVLLALDPIQAEDGRNKQVELLFGDSEESACRSRHKVFSLDEIRNLYICTIWRGLMGTYVEHVAFMTPDGNIYQVLTLPFTTPGLHGPEEVEVAGRRHKVRRAKKFGEEETEVLAILPVAGTYITQYNLSGRWTVKVSLDGQLIEQERVILKKRKSDADDEFDKAPVSGKRD